MLRELKPDGPEDFFQSLWRGCVKENTILMTPPGCCVVLKSKAAAVAVRRPVVIKNKSALEDLEIIAKVAPTRISSSYVEAMRKACELTHL